VERGWKSIARKAIQVWRAARSVHSRFRVVRNADSFGFLKRRRQRAIPMTSLSARVSSSALWSNHWLSKYSMIWINLARNRFCGEVLAHWPCDFQFNFHHTQSWAFRVTNEKDLRTLFLQYDPKLSRYSSQIIWFRVLSHRQLSAVPVTKDNQDKNGNKPGRRQTEDDWQFLMDYIPYMPR
jgi:hypothetical protein